MAREHPEKLAQIQFADSDYTYHPPINCSDIPDTILDRYIQQAARRFYMNPGRLFRIARDYPKRHCLPLYLPRVLFHLKKKKPGNETASGG
jgi:hypothetical protein